ncbi:MAG: TcmI family type II polyketide cyclase [Frankia sp.]
MHRSLIVAKIIPGSEQDIARIFAESDETELPRIAGVSHRSLYSLGDLYVHLMETADDTGRGFADAFGHEEFKRVSDQLRPYIQPYLPTWRSPRDAMAGCFYTYEAADQSGEAGAADRRGEVA